VKKIISSLLISLSLFACGGVPLDENQPVYINADMEQGLRAMFDPVKKKKLIGTWKQVLVGTNRRNPKERGYYIRAGIKEGETRDVMKITFAAPDLDWLPKKEGDQISAVVRGLPKIADFSTDRGDNFKMSDPMVPAAPIEVLLKNDRAVFSIPLFYSYVNEPTGRVYRVFITMNLICGMHDDDTGRLLCEQTYEQQSIEDYFSGKSEHLMLNDSLNRYVVKKYAEFPSSRAGIIGFEKVK
jgi:hypothetical protein